MVNDETDDIIEEKRCCSCKWRKTIARLGYAISNFVATNNEDFKILKYMVDFYIRYKKSRNYNAHAIKLY